MELTINTSGETSREKKSLHQYKALLDTDEAKVIEVRERNNLLEIIYYNEELNDENTIYLPLTCTDLDWVKSKVRSLGYKVNLDTFLIIHYEEKIRKLKKTLTRVRRLHTKINNDRVKSDAFSVLDNEHKFRSLFFNYLVSYNGIYDYDVYNLVYKLSKLGLAEERHDGSWYISYNSCFEKLSGSPSPYDLYTILKDVYNRGASITDVDRYQDRLRRISNYFYSEGILFSHNGNFNKSFKIYEDALESKIKALIKDISYLEFRRLN